MINIKTIWNGLKIKAKSILSSDTLGELEVSSSDNKMHFHNGTSRSPVVTESHSATLSNKTVDADNNTISNIEVDNLKSGVLNTSTSLTSASDTQLPSALAVKTYVDNGLALQNQASEISVDPAVNGQTNVQTALEDHETRIDTNTSDIAAHIADTTDAHDATAISVIPTGNLAASDAQTAFNELQTNIDSLYLDINNVDTGLFNHTTATSGVHGVTGSVVGTSDVQTLTNKSLSDSSTTIVDSTDATKKIKFDVQNSTGVTTTILSNSAFDRTITLPDSTTTLVGTGTVQSLSNKTIDASTNTISNLADSNISASAAITRSKLASGTANKLLANDGSGVMSEVSNVTNSTNAITLSNLKHIELQASDDSTTTGSNALLTAFTAGGVRITNGSLSSIGNIPAGSDGQQFVLFNRTGSSVTIKDSSAAIGTATERILTGTTQDITLTNNAALILSYDATSQKWQVVGGSGGGSGTATSAIDNVFNINDAVDATKQINFDAGGSTGTKTTIAASQTANRTVTLPDATDTLVGKSTTDILTNKTIVAANNTITTAASGKLTSTELNAALAELQSNIDSIDPEADTLLKQTFDIATLSDFTQTGLELVSSPFIHGTKTARLIHQAASTYSFKQVISVNPKFRGYNNTLSLSGRSTATSANLTVTVTDETNSTVLLSSTYTTGQITSAVFNTASSTTVTVTNNAILNQIKVGASITGSGIPTGTTVTAVNTSANTITISNAATATATGVSLKVSVLPVTQRYSFNVPANCSSISYTVSALAESGSPESYIDDVQIYLSESAKTSYSLTQTTFNATDWTAYTPTFTGFGTPSAVEFEYRQVGGNYEIRGKFTCGTTTATEARVSLPASATSAGTSVIPSIQTIGYFARTVASSESDSVLIEPSVTYITFGRQSSGTASLSKVLGTDLSGTISLFASVPIAGLTANTTTTTTIPLSSSVLVTQPDSYLRITGFNGAASGSTATKIATLTSGTIQQNIGSDIQYLDDSTNGARFVAQSEGMYRFQYSADSNNAAVTGFGFSKNSSSLTTDFSGIPASEKIATGYDSSGAAGQVFGEAYLNVGDIIRIHRDGTTAGSSTGVSTFTASKIGSTKILNPSSDQKITIPTHQLRFEGASARGSTDTAIVKFDTQTITQGDGFTVVNTAANGTVVTVRKAGILTVSATLASASNGQDIRVSKNQAVLTSIATTAETIAYSTQASANACQVATGTTPVNVGDVIRVSFFATPNTSGNLLLLSLQEQSVAVALQNVTPTYDNSDSAVQLNTANGWGSTSTRIRRFSNTVLNFGTDITYTDDAALGSSFTINKDGEYHIVYTEEFSAADYFGITLNSASLATAIQSVAASEVLAFTVTAATNNPNTVAWSGYLTKGSVIRAHTSSSTTGSNPARTKFTISRVGKTSGTVDVTPFVNIPQNDVENIIFNNAAVSSANLTSIAKNTNKGILSISSTGVITALKQCHVVATVSSINATTTNRVNAQIYINGLIKSQDSNDTANNNTSCGTTYSQVLEAGDTITLTISGPSDAATGSITATAQNNSVVSSTQNVSSDTLSFVFKSTVIDPNTDAIGTFNTYTYAANTNTATIATSAPTQTTSSMNTNGIQVFARAYNASSTSASPARVDILIGKGLKSKQVDGYISTGKTDPFAYDLILDAAFSNLYGTQVSYNETTGILTISAGINGTAVTNRQIGTNTTTGGVGTSGYFVFNASKSPSLVTIPQLQNRIAVIKDIKSSGTQGGSSVGSVWTTRDLNTINDPTGIVTSLSANTITLPAGSYYFDVSSTYERSGSVKSRLYSPSLGAVLSTDLISDVLWSQTTVDGVVKSFIKGYVTLNSTTTIQLQYICSSAFATYGLGEAYSGPGVGEVYSQVVINKIK